MAGYQQITLLGNVTNAPELKYTQSGAAVCSFGVAVNKRWTDRTSGEQRESTTYFRATCWRALAEIAHEIVHKGVLVFLTGEIAVDAYIGNDGNARGSLEVTVRDLQALGRRERAGDADAEPEADEPAQRGQWQEGLPF